MVTEITNDNFESEIEKSDKLVIIDFWASWCGPCQMMGPVFEEISNDYEDLKFAKINTDENQALANQFRVSGIPCLIVVKNGKEVDRIVGFAPKDALKEKIDAILENIE